MRPMVTLVLMAAVAAFFLLALAAHGARKSGTGPFTWGSFGGDIQNPVEQQSPLPWTPESNVVNPTGCNWDVDDRTYISGAGTLTVDQPETATKCLIADESSYYSSGGNFANNKTVTAEVVSPYGDLDVTMTSTEGGSWLASKAFFSSNHRWVYAICTVNATAPPYPDIPGSNGGHGTRVDYTLAVVADKKVKATAELGIGGGGC